MRNVLVFSTPFCAKCPGVKQKLKAAGIDFEEVNAIQNQDLVNEYGVKGVPTVIVIDDGVWQAYGASNLGEMIGVV